VQQRAQRIVCEKKERTRQFVVNKDGYYGPRSWEWPICARASQDEKKQATKQQQTRCIKTAKHGTRLLVTQFDISTAPFTKDTASHPSLHSGPGCQNDSRHFGQFSTKKLQENRKKLLHDLIRVWTAKSCSSGVMGGGGLRLLPKKSWNVWNYDNREKVRRDEENARVEEEAKKARADLAEQELRIGVCILFKVVSTNHFP
jgi:hypothetical protein